MYSSRCVSRLHNFYEKNEDQVSFNKVYKKTIKLTPFSPCLPPSQSVIPRTLLVNPPPHPQPFPSLPQSRLWPVRWFSDSLSSEAPSSVSLTCPPPTPWLCPFWLNRILMYDCRCDERLTSTTEGSKHLTLGSGTGTQKRGLNSRLTWSVGVMKD